MNRALGIALLISVAALAGAAVYDPGSGGQERGVVSSDVARAEESNVIGTQQFDYTEFRIEMLSNGSARWTFHFERRLGNSSEERQFREFAEEFEENETQLFTDFRQQGVALADKGTNATGRSMNATAFSRHAEVAEELGTDTTGVVEMSFTWRGFAERDGDRVIVGDVFESGLYIGPEQALVIETSDDLTFESVSPDGELSDGAPSESDSVTWRGERRFTDNRPRVVLAPPSAVKTTATPTTENVADDGGNTDSPDEDESTVLSSDLTIAAALAILLVGAVAVVALRRGDALFGESAEGGDQSEDDETGRTRTTGASDAPVDNEEFLSDEDRVVKLLTENDGRLKQVKIVERTGWSKSKVSMLLSDMEEEGTISKLRVGRENIISLDGDEPEAAGSPFDDE